MISNNDTLGETVITEDMKVYVIEPDMKKIVSDVVDINIKENQCYERY